MYRRPDKTKSLTIFNTVVLKILSKGNQSFGFVLFYHYLYVYKLGFIYFLAIRKPQSIFLKIMNKMHSIKMLLANNFYPFQRKKTQCILERLFFYFMPVDIKETVVQEPQILRQIYVYVQFFKQAILSEYITFHVQYVLKNINST